MGDGPEGSMADYADWHPPTQPAVVGENGGGMANPTTVEEPKTIAGLDPNAEPKPDVLSGAHWNVGEPPVEWPDTTDRELVVIDKQAEDMEGEQTQAEADGPKEPDLPTVGAVDVEAGVHDEGGVELTDGDQSAGTKGSDAETELGQEQVDGSAVLGSGEVQQEGETVTGVETGETSGDHTVAVAQEGAVDQETENPISRARREIVKVLQEQIADPEKRANLLALFATKSDTEMEAIRKRALEIQTAKQNGELVDADGKLNAYGGRLVAQMKKILVSSDIGNLLGENLSREMMKLMDFALGGSLIMAIIGALAGK